MLSYLQVEFIKLKRKKVLFWAMLTAIAPPLINMIHRLSLPKASLVNKTFAEFCKFDFTQWFLLPCVLTMLALMIFCTEHENRTMRQLRIIPIGGVRYVFGKLITILIFSVVYMVISWAATLLSGLIIGYDDISIAVITKYLRICITAGGLIMAAMMPVFLLIVAAKKDYILSTCAMLIYNISGVMFAGALRGIHPLASSNIIIWYSGSANRNVIISSLNIILSFVIFVSLSIYVLKQQEG
ncbi:ABC transporter permease [Clostridium oryzae]|uniref:ABC-2 family transporter protein n=1 Tax=Clostridium oryzae TaxID=1450648 RepID=A0A1V4IXT3_9CLOT|nr:ABC transporter permease [Clostridium oryzae]OPJ64640.1 ABC-2 family transporter protein [Clostridium oryzae]